MDHLGTGYYVPTPIRFEKNFPQYSRMQNTGKETKGDWVSLVVDHGKAPKNGSYEYAVLPQTNEALMKKFAKKPTYKVLQQDRNAHIVESVSEQIILMCCLKLLKRHCRVVYYNVWILPVWL